MNSLKNAPERLSPGAESPSLCADRCPVGGRAASRRNIGWFIGLRVRACLLRSAGIIIEFHLPQTNPSSLFPSHSPQNRVYVPPSRRGFARPFLFVRTVLDDIPALPASRVRRPFCRIF